MKYLKIILPSIICIVIIVIFKIGIEYYPVSFGLTIGLVNWNHHKKEPMLGVILSVLISIICFYSTFLSMYVVGGLGDFMFKNNAWFSNYSLLKEIFKSISPFVMSPLLMFFLYRFLFNFSKNKTTIFIIICTILFLFLYNIYINYSGYIIPDYHILSSYIMWQVFMALAFQLIIYQKEVFNMSDV